MNGLKGLIAGNSAICNPGLKGQLFYRGYNVKELAQKSNFEEVLHLLVGGKLPNAEENFHLRQRIADSRRLPKNLREILKLIPGTAHPMDVLRTVASSMGTIEPESSNNYPEAIAVRLVSMYGPALLFWHHYHESGKQIETETEP